MHEIKKEDNGKKGRFAIYEDDQFAGELTFTWAGDSKFIIDHTGIEDNYGGKGFGKKLVKAAVDFARKENKTIIPLCPFAKAVFDKTDDYNNVLA